MDKTGVPCPHVLHCARRIPNKWYLDMFNPRWKKQIPVLTQDEIVWTKAMFVQRLRHMPTKKQKSA
jgi:hypothetical protein